MQKEDCKNITLPSCDLEEDFWVSIARETRPIVVYGMGNGADKLTYRLSLCGKEVADFFASDEFVRGQSFHGKTVLSFSDIQKKYNDFVILVSFGSHLPEVIDRVFALSEEYTLYIPDMPLAGEDYFDAPFYRRHYKSIQEAYALLKDDASRRVFASMIWYKLTASPHYLKEGVYYEDERALLGYQSMVSAVDVGAYRGDTLRELKEYAPMLREVYAIEPDKKNFAKLALYAKALSPALSVSCFHAAAWSEDKEALFSVSGNRNASLICTEGKKTQAKTNLASYKHKNEIIHTLKIDTLIQGRLVNYIKYDTEGAEIEALMGSHETIKECSPALLVSAYHRSEDIFALLLWINAAFPDQYDFYFRRKNAIPAWDLNLLAIPRGH
jgi:FkbM family methyltransferase